MVFAHFFLPHSFHFAVELPSQFLENFLYDKDTVYGFAKHYETGEPMPQEMFQKLCDQKTFNAGMMSCRQLYFGQLDMELHANYDPKSVEKGGESIWDVQKRMASKYIPHSMPLPEDRFLCSFQHIFAGGYSAGYYSYKWAEVMSADAFAAFEEVGLDNEDKVKEVGLSFRDTVLGLGGGKLHQFALPDDENWLLSRCIGNRYSAYGCLQEVSRKGAQSRGFAASQRTSLDDEKLKTTC